MMRVGIHTASPNAAADTYVRQLIRALRRCLAPDDSLVAFDGRRIHPVVARELAECGFEASEIDSGLSRLVSTCLMGLQFDRAAGRYYRGVDVSHCVGGLPARRAESAVIPLIADLGGTKFGAHQEPGGTRMAKRLVAEIAHYPVITTLTEYTRGEILSLTDCDPSRVIALPPGVDEQFFAPERADDEFELQAMGLLPQQYFLSVCAEDDQGYLSPLLAGYSALPPRVKAWLPLIVAGGRRRAWLSFSAAAQRDVDAGNIRLIGRLPVFLRRVLYQKARLVLFSSPHGGFGLSLVEAVVSRATIAMSENSAFAELAGPQALRVDPSDPEQWRQVLADQVDRGAHSPDSVLSQGLSVNQFYWDSIARRAITLYRRVAHPQFEVA